MSLVRETISRLVRLFLAATLVLVVCGSFPTARAERWGILVTLDPSATKPSHTMNFTLTLHNTGDLEVTTCRIDIRYAWESSPQTVTTESRTIAVGKNESWIVQETIPPLMPGTYSATVTVTARTLFDPACTPSDWIVGVDIVPNIPPTAEFTHDPATPAPNTIVYFVDTSTDSDGVVTAWHWDFGDASNSVDRNPSHAFPFAGSYSVVLVVTDNDGDIGSVSHTVQVLSNHPPLAAFSYSPMSSNPSVVVQFSDGSSDPDGSVVEWRWDFGDGTNSTERNPAHQYNSATVYQVVLTVTDNDGATNSVTQNVVLAGIPLSDHPRSTGFGVLEWGLTGAVIAGLSLVAAILIKRKMRPSRRWGQAQQTQEPSDTERRWRPR
jgi:PKD repeat protein